MISLFMEGSVIFTPSGICFCDLDFLLIFTNLIIESHVAQASLEFNYLAKFGLELLSDPSASAFEGLGLLAYAFMPGICLFVCL